MAGSSSQSTTRRTTATTMTAALDDQAARFATDPFLIWGERTISFAEFRDRSLACAAGLFDNGLEIGDRIAILSLNNPEFAELGFAASYANMISVPINVHMKGEFLRHQLVNSAAAAVAVDATGLKELRPLLSWLPDLKLVVLLEPDLSLTEFTGKVIHYEDLLIDAGDFIPASPKPLDLHQILYTSGTSGPSKGCMLSHASRIRVGVVISDMIEVEDRDIQLGTMPLFHLSGQMNVVVALYTGTPLALQPVFSASGFLPRAREVGATFVNGVFSAAELLLLQPELPNDKDHKIRRWLAIPMPGPSQDKLMARFGIDVVGEMYAQTECNPVAGFTFRDQRDRSVGGRIYPDVEVMIADEGDMPLPVNSVGEILLRPRLPGVMFSGYWNDAERTLDGWRNLWHHTGDLGRIDDRGYLTWVDRKKDSMRRKGENISSFELERALMHHPCIAEVATHAVRPEGSVEDEIKACIVLKPDSLFDEVAFAEFVTETLPHFAVPRYVECLGALPRNPTGRIQKFALRERGLTDATLDLQAMGLISGRRGARPSRQHANSNPGE